MTDNDEKKCFICVANGDITEGKVTEQRAPGFGIQGGIYLCEKHSQQMKATLAESSEPQQSHRAEDDPQI